MSNKNYICNDCGAEFEIFMITDKEVNNCPHCASENIENLSLYDDEDEWSDNDEEEYDDED